MSIPPSRSNRRGHKPRLRFAIPALRLLSQPLIKCCLLAATASLTLSAAVAAPMAPEFAAFSAELVGLDREAQSLLGEDQATPVFIGASLDKAWLREVRVQIDALEPVRYLFSEPEARALQDGGLHPLSLHALTLGQHRLRATLVGREASNTPNATRFSGQIERSFQIAPGQALELRLGKGGFMSGAEVELRTPMAGEARLRAAAYLSATGQPLAAQLQLGGATLPSAVPEALAAAEPDASRRYNAAVSLYEQNPAQGLAALDAIGKEEPRSSTALAVRDLANLTLGYGLLRAYRGGEAQTVFDRIRSPGPYANAAMLGLGWAYLVPSARDAGTLPADGGSVLRPGSDDAVAATRRQMPFRYLQAVASGERADDIRRALIPWTELIGRDPLDPAVQEGMLALPYALDHFGAHEQAQSRYRQAVDKLEAARGTLAAASQQLDGSELFSALDRRDADAGNGWSRLLVEQRDDSEAVPLRTLSADPAFAAALDDYRQLRALDRRAAERIHALQALGDGAAASVARFTDLRSRLAPALGAAQQRVRSAGHQQLQRIGQQTERYLAEAHFALARVYDREPHGERR